MSTAGERFLRWQWIPLDDKPSSDKLQSGQFPFGSPHNLLICSSILSLFKRKASWLSVPFPNLIHWERQWWSVGKFLHLRHQEHTMYLTWILCLHKKHLHKSLMCPKQVHKQAVFKNNFVCYWNSASSELQLGSWKLAVLAQKSI